MVPLSAAGVLLNETDLGGNGWNDLCGAATISDNGNSLVGIVNRMVPACCVEHRTAKLFHTREFDVPGEGDCTDGGDKHGGRSLKLDPSLEILQLDIPMLCGLVPSGPKAFNFGMDVLSQVKFVHSVFHV